MGDRHLDLPQAGLVCTGIPLTPDVTSTSEPPPLTAPRAPCFIRVSRVSARTVYWSVCSDYPCRRSTEPGVPELLGLTGWVGSQRYSFPRRYVGNKTEPGWRTPHAPPTRRAPPAQAGSDAR